MYKKLACVWICSLLACPSLLIARGAFEERSITFSETVTENNEEETEKTVINTTEEEKEAETNKEASNVTSEYTVVPGDCLIAIAAKLLGDGSRWHEIVELNKDKYPSLVTNPNLIYPGWVFTIPGKNGGTISNNNGGNNNNSVGNSGNNGNSNNNRNVTNPGPTLVVNPSDDDKTKVSNGVAPKRAVDSGSGAPALIYQGNPTSPCVNSKSPEFNNWFNSAIDTYGDWAMPAIKNQYGQTISVEMYMKAIMWIESNGTHIRNDGSLVKSCCGAQGFMQLMPGTASGLGVDGTNASQNIAGGCKLFKQIFTSTYVGQRSGEDKLILAACGYNAGAWAKCVRGSWQDLKNSGSSVQGYGIKFKMCVGLALTDDEKAYVQTKWKKEPNSYAASLYAHAQGLGL